MALCCEPCFHALMNNFLLALEIGFVRFYQSELLNMQFVPWFICLEKRKFFIIECLTLHF